MNLPSVSAASGSIRAGKLESSTNAAGFPNRLLRRQRMLTSITVELPCPLCWRHSPFGCEHLQCEAEFFCAFEIPISLPV